MRCLECGAKSAKVTGTCARCGAPIGFKQPADPDPLGLPDTWITQQRGPRFSPRRIVLAVSIGFSVLTALLAIIGAKTSSAHAANQLTWDQLRPGDCLAGSSMGLGQSTPWPDFVTRVACTKPHEAEVFFAGDNWPQSLAYPGKQAVDGQADARCEAAFAAYDGTDSTVSTFMYDSVFDDDSSDWSSGARSLECVAFAPMASGPSGGAPVDYSIKGSHK
jgi:hypothetical protein